MHIDFDLSFSTKEFFRHYYILCEEFSKNTMPLLVRPSSIYSFLYLLQLSLHCCCPEITLFLSRQGSPREKGFRRCGPVSFHSGKNHEQLDLQKRPGRCQGHTGEIWLFPAFPQINEISTLSSGSRFKTVSPDKKSRPVTLVETRIPVRNYYQCIENSSSAHLCNRQI